MKNSNPVIVFAIGLTALLSGCSDAPPPPRGFTSEDLLLTQEMVPAGWDRTQVDPVSIVRFGFGNEELDRWVGFVRSDDPQQLVFSNHFVLRFQNSVKAANWYETGFSPWFDNKNNTVNRDSVDHSDLIRTFQFAEQHNTTCATRDAAGELVTCWFKGQYAEFVVLFHSVIESDTTTVAGFNDLVQEVDGIMTRHFQEP